ncbi:hypothetical protein KEM48_001936 [Puccinia striiformis f. sp. tritici PST-130]|uniref:Uncharacterized protein n=1 Tax=Puccinia striiformis f. sp. tritici PST-78 TaxID=1165861 RepID=A0A0L0VFI2_9BASI|nr:hypothetical protein KEM48_001936 [Puccinia striiformis f. sp. tritici PST-130]KNE98045.1 hypothetical protein PSTG_08720 [Puccinia striiformis f. sp. tritici PST-78]
MRGYGLISHGLSGCRPTLIVNGCEGSQKVARVHQRFESTASDGQDHGRAARGKPVDLGENFKNLIFLESGIPSSESQESPSGTDHPSVSQNLSFKHGTKPRSRAFNPEHRADVLCYTVEFSRIQAGLLRSLLLNTPALSSSFVKA